MASPAQTWPGVTQLPDYKPTFPQWKALDLADAVKNVSWLKIHRMNEDVKVVDESSLRLCLFQMVRR